MTERVRVALTLEQCWHRVPGGTAVAALGMARALDDAPDVEPVGVAARHRRPPDPEWTPSVRIEHLGLPRLALYESWHRFRRPRVENATGAVDIVHATSLAIPPRSTTLVVTVHDLAFLHDPSHFTRHGLAFFNRGLALTKEEADVVHCPSQATADDCINIGIERERVRVVPLGIDLPDEIPDAAERVRSRFGIDGSYVLWTGTIEPRKNLRGLLEAWRASAHRDVSLVLVGPQGWNEDLARLIEHDSSIRVLGFVERRALDELYAGATAFCWPSLREGFGFPVLEAMAHGRAVVTSRGTSTEEIAGDAGVLVDPNDPSAIAAALGELLDDPERRSELGARARARAGRFTWANCATKLREAYTTSVGVAA